MKKILVLITMMFAFVAFTPNTIVYASQTAKDAAQKAANDAAPSGNATVGGLIKNVVNVMLFLVGVLSVIVIIWAGIQYVISMGDSGNIGKAKNALIYAVVGLLVSLFAYAIVNFVLDNITGVDKTKKS